MQELVALYREKFKSMGIPNNPVLSIMNGHQLNQYYDMLDYIESFIQEGRMKLAARWLGIIQGVLVASEIYTLKEIGDQSRPADPRNCGECGAPPKDQEVRNIDPVARDGDVYCTKCGAYVRMWDPS